MNPDINKEVTPGPRLQPIHGKPTGLKVSRKWYRRLPFLVSAIVLAIFIIGAIIFSTWYHQSVQALLPGSNKKVSVTVAPAMDSEAIGSLLEEEKIIKSAFAFSLYTSIHRVGNQLQAGTYQVGPGETVAQIVERLTGGDTDYFEITFLPGATLAENRQALIAAGYTAEEVDEALRKPYQGILFTDKPASADLEGYIYGETYHFDAGTSVETILLTAFNEYERVIKEDDLIARFAAQGLNLYEGITLASIIQREVPHIEDQRQVAQVFYTRLAEGMVLGSDVTYMYAAKKLGVPAQPGLDSPYNTRINAGLPPGPIAVPGYTALQAVADPAEGDYVYFLSGDDDVTYFGRTINEHNRNIAEHCQVKCSL